MTDPNTIRPPKWPLKFLRFFVKKEYVEEIEGDMEEIFYDNVEEFSIQKARRQYTVEMLKLLRPILLKNFELFHPMTQHAMFKNYLYAIVAGIAIGLFTIYVLPAEFELFLWPMLIVAIGYFTAKIPSKILFWTGFQHGLVVGISITLTHLILTSDYLSSHPAEKQQITNYDPSLAPQWAMLMQAPIYWLVLGGLSGLLTILWTKVQKSD